MPYLREVAVVEPLTPSSEVRVRFSDAEPPSEGSRAARACTWPSLVYSRLDSAEASCGSPLRAIS